MCVHAQQRLRYPVLWEGGAFEAQRTCGGGGRGAAAIYSSCMGACPPPPPPCFVAGTCSVCLPALRVLIGGPAACAETQITPG
jgi:hypothetical protein